MALSGYRKNTDPRKGGLQLLGLIECGSIASVAYDPFRHCYTHIDFTGEARFARYGFREDQAEYNEWVTQCDGAFRVTHELRFFLERMDARTSSQIEELMRATPGGLIACLRTANGTVLLIGYSPEFGMERPLRLVAAAGSTGASITDPTGETVILQSDDIRKAIAYEGDPEPLFL